MRRSAPPARYRTMRTGRIRVGISGWRYAPWRGKFYPEGLRQKDELAYASSGFQTIEINGTFYSLQRPTSFRAWREATPDGFVFAVKGPRFITHIRRLAAVEAPLANFFASGVLALEDKLGPILWQLPPSFRFDAERLAAFFALLPRTTAEAARLAKRHDGNLKVRAWLKADVDRPLRHALEIRHDSFRDEAFIRLLRRHRIGLVVADTVEWPLLLDATADFVYVRLHGSRKLYTSGYSAGAIDVWARRIMAWSRGEEAEGEHAGPPAPRRGRDVYVYFDNDAKVRAPFDAAALIARIGRDMTSM
ncbi:MAG TPA: DUF72 domain-containing protein [Rhizomicrobium sp.]|nr:DUF72 domain-containing protein [Rhizomicrobium sp.]